MLDAGLGALALPSAFSSSSIVALFLSQLEHVFDVNNPVGRIFSCFDTVRLILGRGVLIRLGILGLPAGPSHCSWRLHLCTIK